MVAQAMQQLAPSYKAQPPGPDPMLQIEQMKIQQRDADSKLDAQVDMAKAQIEAQTEAEDRASRERIAVMKMQNEAVRNNGGFQ
jgi:hypothetical protein